MSSTTNTMQIQTDSVKQASAILRDASRLIASLAEHLTITPECEELVAAIKEHVEIAWVVQTQVYSLPIPELVRTPTTQSISLAQNSDVLISDVECQTQTQTHTYPIYLTPPTTPRFTPHTPPTSPPHFTPLARITTFDSRFNDLPQMPSLMRLSSVIATPYGEQKEIDTDIDNEDLSQQLSLSAWESSISSTPFRLSDRYPDSDCEEDELLLIPRPLLTRQMSANLDQDQDLDLEEDPLAMPTMTRQTSVHLPPSSLQDTDNSLSMTRGITYYDPLNECRIKSHTTVL
jgi:hypothetical protein